MTSSHDYVDFDDTIGEYNKMIDEYRDENKQLRKLLDEMQQVVRNGVQFWNSRAYRDASDSLLERIDEVLNEQTRTT